MTLCGWEGNRRFRIALAVRCRFRWSNHQRCKAYETETSFAWSAAPITFYANNFLLMFRSEIAINCCRRLRVASETVMYDVYSLHVCITCVCACMRVGVERVEGGQVAGDFQHSSAVFSHCHLSRHRSPGNRMLLTCLLTWLTWVFVMFPHSRVCVSISQSRDKHEELAASNTKHNLKHVEFSLVTSACRFLHRALSQNWMQRTTCYFSAAFVLFG